MKLSILLTACIYVLNVFAASKSRGDRFQIYHSRSLSSTPLDLEDATYEDLTSAPRDYTVAILLTALEAKYGCQICREFQPEWDLIAKSWSKGDKRGEGRMLYGTLDFNRGKETFQKVRTERSSVLIE